MIDEITPNQINLKSFEPKKELNPKFFNGDTLKSEIRLKLLDIADDFWNDLNITWVKPIDIVITGSIVNYNWSKYSDIDIHIIVDYREISENDDLTGNYLSSKGSLWQKSHEIDIYGYPVELYVENIDEPSDSSGVYSLETNDWLIKPTEFDEPNLNKKKLQLVSSKIMTKIDNLELKINNDELTDSQLDDITKKLNFIIDKLKHLRKTGLKTKNKEFSFGNILWKILRRAEYIDKIFNLLDKIYDKKMSLETI